MLATPWVTVLWPRPPWNRHRAGSPPDGTGPARAPWVAVVGSDEREPLLATTSVGQEGLDFHPYCHAVYHWDLPSNPVDMEQREGRVHRYKGHAVRKNVARRFGLASLRERWSGGDPWEPSSSSPPRHAQRGPTTSSRTGSTRIAAKRASSAGGVRPGRQP
jgi:hypothetical protein